MILSLLNHLAFSPLAAAPAWWTPQLAKLVWPALFALVLLIGTVVAILARWRLGIWPCAAGCLTQLIGTGLLYVGFFKSAWPPFLLTLGVIALVALTLGGMRIGVTLRARALERKMMAGIAGSGGVDEQQVARLREEMDSALQLLQKAGKGRGAVYALPWFLMVGRAQAGKTVAIKNSGLNLPVRKDWNKGAGGTHTCDWFFTNEAIFLDTPGKWSVEGTTPIERGPWLELLRLLRKHREQRPLDGLLVLVPADDLLTRGEEELRDQAGKIRDLIDLIHEHLGFHFPVYLMISKTDLVDGFVPFFRGLPPQRRNEIFGCSFPGPGGGDPASRLRQGFAQLLRELHAARADLLARVSSRRQGRKLFFFPEEFRRLEQPLAAFADVLFRMDRYHEPPFFRGFFFTSGTQGEGLPQARALGDLARTVGLAAPPPAPAAEEEAKRGYFLLDLFRNLMVEDQGLAGATSGHTGRRRKLRLAACFAPAAAALLFLSLSSCSYLLNRASYQEMKSEIPRVVAQLNGISGGETLGRVRTALPLTEKLETYYRRLTGISVWRGFWMRRAAKLETQVQGVYRGQFQSHVLQPVLAAAAARAADARESCADRLEILHGVVGLRMGKGSGWLGKGDTGGLDKVFKIPAEQAAELRSALGRQYAAVLATASTAMGTQLPGFSLRQAAESIKADCFTRTASSALELYLDFQRSCQGAGNPADFRECYSRLKTALRFEAAQQENLLTNIEEMKAGLAELSAAEAEANAARQLFEGLQLSEVKTGECLGTFASQVAPLIRDYAEQDDLLSACRDEVNATPGGPAAKLARRDEILRDQAQELQKKEEPLKLKLQDFTTACRGSVAGFDRLEMGVVKRVTEGYRRASCLELGSQLQAGAEASSDLFRKFPFSPGRSNSLADVKSLVENFGGKSGQWLKLRETTGGKGLSGTVLSWLERATNLSRLLFEEGTDDLKPARVRFTLLDWYSEDKDLKDELKDTRMEVQVYLGERQQLVWKPEDPKTRTATIDLFGSEASEAASVKAVIARKISRKRGFGEGESTSQVTVEGNWAPLRLVAQGLAATEKPGVMAFDVTWQYSKRKAGKMRLRFEVEGADLGALMSLMNQGFPPPPKMGGGE